MLISDIVCSLDSCGRHATFKKEVSFISKVIYYPVTFLDYFLFFFTSFRPFYFTSWLIKTKSPYWATLFFSINFCLSIAGWTLENIIEAPQRKVYLQIFSEMLFFFPVALIGFVVLALVLYFCSILLGGKASFYQSLSVMGLSSYPIIWLFIPWLSPLVLFYWSVILVLSFQKIYHYRMAYAVICVVCPFLIISAFMYATGFIKLPINLAELNISLS